MNILIIGCGGREHALAWKARQSKLADKVYVAPGNAGTALEPGVDNVLIDATEIDKLLQFAKDSTIGLTIVGPEVPLVAGIVDQFTQADIKCFGPTQKAAQLEGSKTYCKDFMKRHNIPTAEYQSFISADNAIAYVQQKSLPIVIKADGLAAGKGVVIAETEIQAVTAIQDMLSGNAFGEAGSRVVIEEFLTGEEASFIVIADGVNALPMATSQDHKARDDGDKGPNTGGMGAYSPAPVVTEELHEKIMQQIIMPTLDGLAIDGIPYTGFLYAGLMIKPDGDIKVLEYNCRFGDPETQPIMMRLKSDLIELCIAAIDQKLHQCQTDWDEKSALGVVLAAGGYPDSYQNGDAITGLSNEQAGQKVFHAGTEQQNGEIVTSGGRVLCASALGNTLSQAKISAYQLVNKITWNNMYYRHDIGDKGINR